MGKPITAKRKVLDLYNYVPTYLAQVGNKWARSSSRIYLRRFGVGVNEWRVLAIVAIESQITISSICSIIGMDKAAVGRSVSELEKRGAIRSVPNRDDGRSRLLSLTEDGWKLHGQIIEIALDRERQLLTSFTKEERATLIKLLAKLRANIMEMQSKAD